MSKHTPGPWENLDHVNRRVNLIYHLGEDTDGENIAEVQNSPNRAANAQLISAAPDMLEALIALHAAYMDLRATAGGFADDSAREARNAIAKATGGAE